jgi:hypothetical protein
MISTIQRLFALELAFEMARLLMSNLDLVTYGIIQPD